MEEKQIAEKRGVVVTVCVIGLAFIPPQISTDTNTNHKEGWRFVLCLASFQRRGWNSASSSEETLHTVSHVTYGAVQPESQNLPPS